MTVDNAALLEQVRNWPRQFELEDLANPAFGNALMVVAQAWALSGQHTLPIMRSIQAQARGRQISPAQALVCLNNLRSLSPTPVTTAGQRANDTTVQSGEDTRQWKTGGFDVRVGHMDTVACRITDSPNGRNPDRQLAEFKSSAGNWFLFAYLTGGRVFTVGKYKQSPRIAKFVAAVKQRPRK